MEYRTSQAGGYLLSITGPDGKSIKNTAPPQHKAVVPGWSTKQTTAADRNHQELLRIKRELAAKSDDVRQRAAHCATCFERGEVLAARSGQRV